MSQDRSEKTGQSGQRKGSSKPDIVLRGKNTFLSVWLSGNRLKVSVTRRGDNGVFEHVDDFVLNLDYLLFIAVRKPDSRGVVNNVCELLSSLAESDDNE